MGHARGLLAHGYVLQFLFENFEKLFREFDALGTIPYLLEDIANGDYRLRYGARDFRMMFLFLCLCSVGVCRHFLRSDITQDAVSTL